MWEVKHVMLVPKDEQGLPDKPLHLVVAQSVMDPSEVKYFLSNAPTDTLLCELLMVAFSRWQIERCFEDQKTEYSTLCATALLAGSRGVARPRPRPCL